MQYLFSVIHDSDTLATADEMTAIDVFNVRLQAEGRWVFAGGLAAPDTATVIDNRGAEPREASVQAIELVGNTAETAYLTRRRDQSR